MGNKFKFKVGDRVGDSITGTAKIVQGYIEDYYCMAWENSTVISNAIHKDHYYWANIKKIEDKKTYTVDILLKMNKQQISEILFKDITPVEITMLLLNEIRALRNLEYR